MARPLEVKLAVNKGSCLTRDWYYLLDNTLVVEDAKHMLRLHRLIVLVVLYVQLSLSTAFSLILLQNIFCHNLLLIESGF